MKHKTDFTEEDVELSLKNYLHENGWTEIGTDARTKSFDYTTWMNLQDVLFWAAECFIQITLDKEGGRNEGMKKRRNEVMKEWMKERKKGGPSTWP